MSSIDDFVVACEVGDLAWMRRCLRGGVDPAGRDRQVRACCVVLERMRVVVRNVWCSACLEQSQLLPVA